MQAITEEEDDVDMADVVVESWLQRHKEGRLIRFEELYQHDLQGRGIIAGPEIAGDEDIPAVDGQELPILVDVVEMIENMKVGMIEQLNEIIAMISGLEKRVEPLEAFMEAQKAEKRKDQEEKNKEKDGDPKETHQEKDGDPKEKNQ
ncbi:unnamed protein product [Arabidopsis halleri]